MLEDAPVRNRGALWHPFADMCAVTGNELVIARGDDVWVWDEQGNRYLDATASLWYANIGHGRREIADAVAQQMRELEAYSMFGDLANRPAIELADRLAQLAPVGDAKVFLASGGGDGIDTAAKIARRYWGLRGQAERTQIVTRRHSYHGTHGFGTALAGIATNREGWGPLIDGVTTVAHDSHEALRATLEQIGPERVAAFFMEPVIGAGGVLPPPPGYVEGVAAVCRETGVLLVVDAVICGFGRLGTWFGIERWDVSPDLIVFAKGVTSGYLPLGGVVVAGHVAEPFWSDEAGIFRHGATYAGHATCCAAALANLDLLEQGGLVNRGRELEGALDASLDVLRDHPLVTEVRAGVGLMAAVDVDVDRIDGEANPVVALQTAVRRAGVLVRPLSSGLALSPPLTATEAHFRIVADAIGEALDGALIPHGPGRSAGTRA